jgi:hypothetical protein
MDPYGGHGVEDRRGGDSGVGDPGFGGHGFGGPGFGGGDRCRRRWPWLIGLLVMVLLLGAGAAVAAGAGGRGPLGDLAFFDSTRGGGIGTVRRPSTSAPQTPSRGSFRSGDCLVWDGPAPGPQPDVVPCTQPHFLEITAGVKLDDLRTPFPSPADWAQIVSERCLPPAETHIGAKLDPAGRFSPGGLSPSETSWRRGDRLLWCAIQAGWTEHTVAAGVAVANRPTALTGPARGQPQFWVYLPGDCLGATSPAPVPCTQPHQLEVVGETTLPERPSVPAAEDHAAWQALVGETCEKQVRSYLGAAPAAPWATGWRAITPGSWAAGKRNVTCAVGSSTADGWATVSVPARTAAR